MKWWGVYEVVECLWGCVRVHEVRGVYGVV